MRPEERYPQEGGARITGNRCLGLFTVFRCRRCKELERRGRYSNRSFNVPWYSNAEGALTLGNRMPLTLVNLNPEYLNP